MGSDASFGRAREVSLFFYRFQWDWRTSSRRATAGCKPCRHLLPVFLHKDAPLPKEGRLAQDGPLRSAGIRTAAHRTALRPQQLTPAAIRSRCGAVVIGISVRGLKSKGVWGCMANAGTGAALCIRHPSPRMWGAYQNLIARTGGVRAVGYSVIDRNHIRRGK
jgi:hypothetical protein